jgi:7-cyano-7-deazaguanine synthase
MTDTLTPQVRKSRIVVICSGGLDSVTLLYYALSKTRDVHVASFDYGQRHAIELEHAARLCADLELDHEIIDLTRLQPLLRSTLTFVGDVPEGHYAADNMSQTVVPNRNAIMLACAYGWASSLEADSLWVGAHAGDHPIYPDCREEFFVALNRAFELGSNLKSPPKLSAPFVLMSKKQIVELGAHFGVPFERTWSCYKGSSQPLGQGKHCGRCGTCVERAESFSLAGVPDPTPYEDSNYWKAVTHG